MVPLAARVLRGVVDSSEIESNVERFVLAHFVVVAAAAAGAAFYDVACASLASTLALICARSVLSDTPYAPAM